MPSTGPCPTCHGHQTVSLGSADPSATAPCPELYWDPKRRVAACRLPDGSLDLTPYARGGGTAGPGPTAPDGPASALPPHLFSVDGCYFSILSEPGGTEEDGVHSQACWCNGVGERIMLDGIYEWRNSGSRRD
jgi:hypothetical protein